MSDDNPFAPMTEKLVVAIKLSGLVMLIVSLCILIWGSPSAFQRAGTLWIAFVLLSFGALKYTTEGMKKGLLGKGPFASMIQAKLSPVLYSENKGWLNYMSADGEPYDRRLFTQGELATHLEEFEDHVYPRIVPTEFVVAAFATLQSGYGDLFFCLFRSHGNIACSF